MDNSTVPYVPFDECTLSTCDMSRAMYQYIPSLAANVFFVAFFSAVLVFGLLAGVKSRTWFFTGAMLCGCLCEIIGYVGRVMSHSNPFSLNPFLIQICCLTIGPAFFSASIYWCLSKFVVMCGQEYSRLRPRQYTLAFCLCDVVSLTLQGTGGGFASSASEKREDPYVGDDIMLAGLSTQVFSLILFMALGVEYFWRAASARKAEGEGKGGRAGGSSSSMLESWEFRTCVAAVSLATIFVLVRSVYRVVELSEGWNGYLIGVERYFIILEGLMIVLAAILLCAFHPVFWLSGWSIRGVKDDVEGVVGQARVVVLEKPRDAMSAHELGVASSGSSATA